MLNQTYFPPILVKMLIKSSNNKLLKLNFNIDPKTYNLRNKNSLDLLEKKKSKSLDDPLENIQNILNLKTYKIDK